jgi:hypothetical protein
MGESGWNNVREASIDNALFRKYKGIYEDRQKNKQKKLSVLQHNNATVYNYYNLIISYLTSNNNL